MPQYRGGYRSGGRRIATGGIVGIAIAGFVVLLAALLCLYCCCFRKRRANRKGLPNQKAGAAHPPPPRGGGGLSGMFGRLMPGRTSRQRQYADMEQAGYGQRPQQGYDPGYGNGVNGANGANGVGDPSYGPGYQPGSQSYGYGPGQNAGVKPPPPAYR
ncbi:hypothetical protein SODALDRAFT_351006 [Sodiomyces alkalinus F11]|uniref:Uncharacterized protein n=1 Tax=Sodiomyces alkalinus (strain CBS 110278 / VKM F-3762 / F11) TaxID=1314773 RepID=A0A3N2PTC4_SODAK|nr:hypothetical protein SODALDRAFT_351006 [Sodiomyces alkalinus F11]ROT37769.1 hypothetical protein SODALDRAFT_351006 [Sodiomyces alkalinus F11]